MANAVQVFLDVLEDEHARTMKVLRAYPADQADLRPHPKCKTARELAWVFVAECYLGMAVMKDQLEQMLAGGGSVPEAPQGWDEILAALESVHRDFADLVGSYDEAAFAERVKFFTGPGKIEPLPRRDLAWFLLHDQIHHRGQLSIYLRMADAKVPSIYGPSADEPWM